MAIRDLTKVWRYFRLGANYKASYDRTRSSSNRSVHVCDSFLLRIIKIFNSILKQLKYSIKV